MDSTLIWNGNWAWSLPLIVLNVIFHVLGLGLINAKVIQALSVVKGRRHFLVVFALVMGIATLLAILLHAIEAGIWAVAYRLLGALPEGGLGGSKRDASVWTYDCFFLRYDSASLAGRDSGIQRI